MKKSSFLPILNNWSEYFEQPEEGFGTAYERWALEKIFVKIAQNFRIESVLEVPLFGMTGVSGINSIWWQFNHCPVCLMDNHLQRLMLIKQFHEQIGLAPHLVFVDRWDRLPIRSNAFDMSWNFAAIWFVRDLHKFFQELKRVTRKVIFIAYPNRLNIGFIARRFFFKVPPELNLKNIQRSRIISAVQDERWRVWDSGFFDVPPWPDIPIRKEKILEKIPFIQPRRKNRAGKNKINTSIKFASSHNLAEQRFKKFAFLENSPTFIKLFWAHHQYLIFSSTEG